MNSGKSLRRSVLFLYLLITTGVSVWADGLPGEYLLTQRWRDMIASHSPLTNPAFMTEENYLSGRLALASVLGGEFKFFEAGAIYPIGLYQSVGVSVLGENDDASDGILGSKDPNETNGQIISDPSLKKSNKNYFIMFSYAYHFWNKFSAGVNLNYAYQTCFGDAVMGTGLDLGISYRLLRHPLFGDHVLGLSTKNLLAPSMGKSPLPKFGSNSQYSRDLKFTWLSNYWERRIESALDIDMKDFLTKSKDFLSDSSKIDAAKKMEWDLNYKIGAWMLRIFKIYTQFGFDEDALDYWGMALGVNIPAVNNGRDLEILYQYNLMTEQNSDASSHTIYLRMDLGKHREEMFARKMARLASLSPNELYNKARKLYSEQKYWDAFFVFSRILVEFPDFFKNDWVQHFRASCQEQLDMRDQAVKNYENMKKEFPLSSAVPYTDLGLMRVLYRNGDFARVALQFDELNKPNVPDSLRFHGAYLMGQTHLQSNDPQKAIQLFSIIPETHPDYVFAQHAIAVAHARLNDDMSQIVSALENAIGAKVVTNAQKEIQSRSYLFLGYIFYEENTVSKAVVALRMIPTTSYYAEDALLGQGWTALKARQWNDCITTGQMLTKTSNKGVLQCEGMLIQAYGHLLQKDYPQALQLLQTASDKIKSMQAPSEDTLNYEKTQYESDRVQFNFLAERVEGLSMVGQNASQLSSADSMHNEQQQYMTKFNNYYKFAEDFNRSTFFCRNINQVRDDIEYALATVQKIVGHSSVQKEQQKMENKQQQIDSQIQQLEKEMQQLQNSN